jgi:epoxide hydrolase-like predicted phosphatase
MYHTLQQLYFASMLYLFWFSVTEHVFGASHISWDRHPEKQIKYVRLEPMDNLIEAVIWDMGGVLLRTEDPLPRRHLAERLGITLEELYTTVFMSSSADTAMVGKIDENSHWNFVLDKFGLAPDQLQEFEKDFWAGDRLDEELVDGIGSLRPRYRTALLSNAWSDARLKVTQNYQLLHAFDLIIFSAEIGLAKPDSAIFIYLLDKLALPPAKTVFIDDVPANVEGARKLGMHGIVFRNREQVLDELVNLGVKGK